MYRRPNGAAAEVPRATVRIRPPESAKNASMRRCKRENTLNPPTGTHPAHGAALAPVNHPAASDDES